MPITMTDINYFLGEIRSFISILHYLLWRLFLIVFGKLLKRDSTQDGMLAQVLDNKLSYIIVEMKCTRLLCIPSSVV